MIFTADPTEFIWHYSTYEKKDELRERVQKHLAYKTCRVVLDKANLVCAVCLWNISPDQVEARVADMVIREDYSKKDLMRRILIDGMKIWPVKFLRYCRDYTKDGSNRGSERIWSVERFLRRRA